MNVEEANLWYESVFIQYRRSRSQAARDFMYNLACDLYNQSPLNYRKWQDQQAYVEMLRSLPS